MTDEEFDPSTAMGNDGEARAIRKGNGKWGQPNVPHKGWHCIDVHDHEEFPAMTCEMCETMGIRYECIMEHPDHPERLGCGRICAATMSEDYAGTLAQHDLVVREARNRKARARREAQREAARREEDARFEAAAEARRQQQAAKAQAESDRRAALTQDERDAEDAAMQRRYAPPPPTPSPQWRPQWRYAQATGNPWFKHRGFRCTVFPNKKGGWSYVINDPSEKPHYTETRYDERNEAMEAASRLIAAVLE